MCKYNNQFSLDETLKKSLNLNYLTYTNKSYGVGRYDLMHLVTPAHVDLDYLALYSNPSEYAKTPNTAVYFSEYDSVFDGREGLWNSIYYNDMERLEGFRKRFERAKYFISPDYSLCGDVPESFNIYNIQRSRIVSIWLTIECNSIVIPEVTYADEKSFSYMLDGLEDCNVVAFSAKGSLKKKEQRSLFVKAIDHTIDTLKDLRQIVVYDVSADFAKTRSLYFSHATAKGIELTFPDNVLHDRNVHLRGKRHGQI